MISIRRYLQDDKQTQEQLLQLSKFLIEGVERHVVAGPTEELERLRQRTQTVLAAIDAQAPPSELLALSAQAMEALKEYNSRVADYLRQPIAEMQAKIRLLTEAITSISSSSSENIRRLQQIKGRMLASVEVKDVRNLKTVLAECLDGVLNEAERQRAQADRAALQLHHSSHSPKPENSQIAASAIDPATGFPTRAQAEEAIAQACQEEAQAFVAVMVINQMQNVNRSFGHQLGDAMLRRFATAVRENLPAIDQLFRWSGPTIVALIRRKKALDTRAALEPILNQRLSIRTGNPEVQLPISARWTVIPLTASPRLLFRKMDSFAESN